MAWIVADEDLCYEKNWVLKNFGDFFFNFCEELFFDGFSKRPHKIKILSSPFLLNIVVTHE